MYMHINMYNTFNEITYVIKYIKYSEVIFIESSGSYKPSPRHENTKTKKKYYTRTINVKQYYLGES